MKDSRGASSSSAPPERTVWAAASMLLNLFGSFVRHPIEMSRLFRSMPASMRRLRERARQYPDQPSDAETTRRRFARDFDEVMIEWSLDFEKVPKEARERRRQQLRADMRQHEKKRQRRGQG